MCVCVENLQKIRSAELKSFFQGFRIFQSFESQMMLSMALGTMEAILGDETMISYVLWNKNMMQELILVSCFWFFTKFGTETVTKTKIGINHECLSVGGKTNFGKTLRPKVLPKFVLPPTDKPSWFLSQFLFSCRFPCRISCRFS